ncbi:hypothetical protein P691DRAFT_767226 [Macrolepiota fuliginosa MF-IS2]|uniref:Uncharacterized protein n=1 Tax=Macrolepiota fuliginosa MF-IS2 TaxID=1400762 RepID=A0A9P6BWJ3_9AGAR|nr:hypothetical protein P691DRAFT_767226 [Macrolepiota fuliginosa MF-IS2]
MRASQLVDVHPLWKFAWKKEIIAELQETHNIHILGAQLNNWVACMDYAHTVKGIQDELDSLAVCTGAVGFTVISQSHVNNSTQLVWLDSNSSLNYLKDKYNVTGNKVTCNFELWACSNNGKKEHSLSMLQKACTKMILESFNKVLNHHDICMSWENFD